MRSFGAGTRPPTLAAVLDIIRDQGPISRVELASETGLTQATMTHAVRKLMALGYVHETGTVPSSRGKPRRLLELAAGACYMVGIQFDRFAAVGVLVDLAGRVVARRRMAGAGEREPGVVVAEFAGHVRSLLEDAGVDRSAVAGIGLATHGPQDRDAGVLLTPQPTPAWLGYPVAATLAEATGLPVTIENDATAAGIGIQAAKDAPASFAVVFMSAGIGAGIMLDGHPYRGTTSNGVELGHISIDARGARCDCGNRGCLDTVAGPTAVASRARADAGLAARLRLDHGALPGTAPGSPSDPLSVFLAVAGAARDGDPAAAGLVEESARMLATATVTLVNLFDVGRVVLAGNAFTGDVGPVYRDALQAVLERSVFMRHVHTVRAELAPDVALAPAVGAAAMVLRSLLESPPAPAPQDADA
ncbi:ROK family transcriptional regulator [Myceligenerans crystallogenes]|uniref:ROK family transcriptional regulator n=1 Tax=Myceligenerans crystallogenes TaxID=316335 RepID=A0ABN2NNT0_9MICO